MRSFVTHNWLTVVVLINMLLIVVTKLMNPERFSVFFESIIAPKYLKVYQKENLLFDAFNSLLYFNAAISFSVFFGFVYTTYFENASGVLKLTLQIFSVLTVFYLAKKLIHWFVGLLLGIKPVIYNYLFYKITFISYSGIVVLVFNVLLIYTNSFKNILIFIGLGLIFIINCVGFINSLKKHQKLIYSNFVYFLLYLCALEFAPYIFIYKVVSDYNF